MKPKKNKKVSPVFFLKRWYLYFCLFIFINTFLFAQSDSALTSSQAISFNKPYFQSYWYDVRDITVAPFHWKEKNLIIATALLGTTFLLSTQDLKVYSFSQENRNSTTDKISKYGLEPWGSGVYSLPSLGLFYLHGELFSNDRNKKVAMLGLKAYVITNLFVHTAKQMFHRHRPFQVEDESSKEVSQYIIDGPFSNIHYTSFPSGHATRSFAMAAILAFEYKDKPIIPILSYSIASLTSLSRINDNEHWASDVLAGAIIGYSIGRFIYKKNNWGLNIYPLIKNQEIGLLINIPLKKRTIAMYE